MTIIEEVSNNLEETNSKVNVDDEETTNESSADNSADDPEDGEPEPDEFADPEPEVPVTGSNEDIDTSLKAEQLEGEQIITPVIEAEEHAEEKASDSRSSFFPPESKEQVSLDPDIMKVSYHQTKDKSDTPQDPTSQPDSEKPDLTSRRISDEEISEPISPEELNAHTSASLHSQDVVQDTTNHSSIEELDRPDTSLEFPKKESLDKVGRDSEVSTLILTDSAVLEELKQADQKATLISSLINELKQSLQERREKKEVTEDDKAQIEKKHQQLMEKLTEFENMTLHVQGLVGLEPTVLIPKSLSLEEIAEPFSTEVPPPRVPHEVPFPSVIPGAPLFTPPVSTAFSNLEDRLPNVIVTGLIDGMPGIVVCHKPVKRLNATPEGKAQELVGSLAGRLSDSYSLQEKLASENVDLETSRFTLEQALLQKDSAVETLQKKVEGLQKDIKIMMSENCSLSEQLTRIRPQVRLNTLLKGELWLIDKNAPFDSHADFVGDKPAGDMATRIKQYSHSTAILERQMNELESEVKSMNHELQQVQSEREKLQQQRKLLKCTTPTVCTPATCPTLAKQQLRELREKYARLQQDYDKKVQEVSQLRVDAEKHKDVAERAREEKEAAEAQNSILEDKLRRAELESKRASGMKDKMLDIEQQLQRTKQSLEQSKYDLEEAQGELQEKSLQCANYRNKYMQAEQTMEEQRRQLEKMEMNTAQATSALNIEIQRIKSQFQEKLQNLAPLPDLLNLAHKRVQEANQQRIMAECKYNEIAQELKDSNEKLQNMSRHDNEQSSRSTWGSDERSVLQARIESLEKKCAELKTENASFKKIVSVLEQDVDDQKKLVEEKEHDVAQLSNELEALRQETARTIARTKETADRNKHHMLGQLQEYERLLAQSRAGARAAQKDRDEIRQRLQSQINDLNDNFDQAQMRIQTLQSHVNVLKTSYSNIFAGEPPPVLSDSQSALDIDACYCNNYP
uniref:(California timema) hypothetical protein n=1 Tax=Timema californicum TaxID=61474 RepID=A0A7R9P669_TIMCA|nr:unnamed protein product [Timema californicum]